jgi:preprotein translocase subunit SecG
MGFAIGGGGGGGGYRVKRGAEKFFFNLTIILTVLFVVNGLAIAIVGASA